MDEIGCEIEQGRSDQALERTEAGAEDPVDRLLGAGFGALKGLIWATLLYLAANLVYDTIHGQSAPRPDWMSQSRTYPLLYASGRAIVDFVQWRRGDPPAEKAQPLQNAA